MAMRLSKDSSTRAVGPVPSGPRVSIPHDNGDRVGGSVNKHKRKENELLQATLHDLNEKIGRLEDRDTQQQAFISLVEMLPRLDPSLVGDFFVRIEKNKNPERASTRRMLVLLLAALCKCHPLPTARLMPRILVYLAIRLRDKQVQITDACVILCSSISLYVIPNTGVHAQHGGLSPRKKAVDPATVLENDYTPVFEHVTNALLKEASSVGEHANRCVCGLLYPVEFDGTTRPAAEVLRNHGLRIHFFVKTMMTKLVMKLNESTMYNTFSSTFLLLHTLLELTRDLEQAEQATLYNDMLSHVPCIIDTIEDVFRVAPREDWVLRERGIKLIGLLVDVFAVGETARDSETVTALFESRSMPIRRIVTDARQDPVSTVREAALALISIFNKFEKLFPRPGELQRQVSPFKRVFNPKGATISRKSSSSLYNTGVNHENFSPPHPRVKLRERTSTNQTTHKTPWWNDIPLDDKNEQDELMIPSKAESKNTVGDNDVVDEKLEKGEVNEKSKEGCSDHKPTANVEGNKDNKSDYNTSNSVQAKSSEEDVDIVDLGGDESVVPFEPIEDDQEETPTIPLIRRKIIKSIAEPKDAVPIRQTSSKNLVVDNSTLGLIKPVVREPSEHQLEASREPLQVLKSDNGRNRSSYSHVPVVSTTKDDDVLPDFDANNVEGLDENNDAGDQSTPPPLDIETSTIPSKALLAKASSSNVVQTANTLNNAANPISVNSVFAVQDEKRVAMTRAEAALVAAENGETEFALRLCFLEDNQELLLNVLGQMGTAVNIQVLSRSTRNALCASFLELLDDAQDSYTMWIVIPWLRSLASSSRVIEEMDPRVMHALEERLQLLSMEPTKLGLVAADLLFKIET